MYEIVLAFATLTFLAVGAYYVRSGLFSPYHPFTFYCAFHGLVFVIRPWIAWYCKYDLIYLAFQFWPSQSDKITAILATTLGFVVFAAVCLRIGNVPMRFRQDRATHDERRRLFPTFIWVVVLCGPIAIYSLFHQWQYGLEGMVLDRSTGISINTTANGYLVDAQLMLVSLCAVVAWINRFRLMSLAPLAFFVLYRAGTGGRAPFIAAIVSVGLFYLFERRHLFPPLRIALLLIPSLLLFRLVGDDRGASVKNFVNADGGAIVATTNRPTRLLESMDYANLEFMEYLVYVIPQRSGTYDYFLSNLQIFTEPVPRVFWPDKPVGPPISRVDLMRYGQPIGMTLSVTGQGWYALGWLGVVIWSGLFGWAMGLVYRKFVNGPQSAFQTAAYMVFVPSLIVGYRDGSVLTLLRSTGVYMVPIILWYVLSRLLGLPSVASLRKAALARVRPWGIQPELITGQMDSGQRPDEHLAGLPPPVRRRRLALMAPDAG